MQNRNGLTSISGLGLNVFSRDQMDTIHNGACHILKHTGVLVEQEEAAERFSAAGAFVKKKGNNWLVKIPEWIVTDCIASAPKNVTFYAREPQKNVYMEKGNVAFSTFGEQVNIIDLETRECRKTKKKDCSHIYRLTDVLEGLAFCQRTVCPGDKPAVSQAVHNFESYVKNSSKHITIGMVDKHSVETIVKMAAAAAGGMDRFQERPFCTCSCCPTSPLTLVSQCCELIIASVEAGINVDIMTMVLSGGTGPVTLAGTVVLTIAEQLSGLVLAQIVKKGAAVTFGSCSTIMDLKTGLTSVGAPEWGAVGTAVAKMSQYYGISCRIGAGVSDSKVPDAQAGYEFALNTVPLALSGANMVFGAGGIESGLTFDYAKLIMDHECIANIHKLLNGVTIDNDTMLLDLIDEVGPGGSYLSHEHTFKNTRCQSQAVVFDRKAREQWLHSSKGKDLIEKAYEKAKHLLNNHKPVVLLDGAENTIRGLVEEFEESQKADT